MNKEHEEAEGEWGYCTSCYTRVVCFEFHLFLFSFHSHLKKLI